MGPRLIVTASLLLFGASGFVFGILTGVGITSGSPTITVGDINCSGGVDSVDALVLLKDTAHLPNDLPPGCPAIGTVIGSAPTPTPSPTPVTSITFGDGTWVVGPEVPPGLWRNSDSSASCYWKRLSGFGGTLGEIIANNLDNSIQTVQIKASDAGFQSEHCGTWSQTLVPPSSGPDQPFGPGVWLVGQEVMPGTWRNSDSSASCYWKRLSGFGGTLGEIIANNFDNSIQTVQIKASDTGFQSERCGTWTRIAN